MERLWREDTDGIRGQREQLRVPRLSWKKKKGNEAKQSKLLTEEELLVLLNKSKVRVQGI